MATACSDTTLAALLQASWTGFQFERILGPQQENGTDCGFYVMLAMKHLVEGANASKPPKQWGRQSFPHLFALESMRFMVYN